MTKDVLPGIRSRSYTQHKDIVTEFAETVGVGYEVPTILEAVTCILAEYTRSGKRLFGDNPYIYIDSSLGVAAWRKF